MVSSPRKLALWWHRAGLASRIFLFVIGSLVFSLLVYWQRPDEESTYLGSNLLVFVLVNLNVAILCIFVFLVGRNVVKLIFDRRRRILGSKLRLRLVVAFVSLTLVPTAILFFLASGLLNRAMDGWFSSQVERSVTGAVEIAKLHYNSLETRSRIFTEELRKEIEIYKMKEWSSQTGLRELLEQRRRDEKLFSIRLLDTQGQEQFLVSHATAELEPFKEPVIDQENIQKALSGETVTGFEEQGQAQFIRVYTPLRIDGKYHVLVVSHRLASELVEVLSLVNSSFKEYQQLKLFQNPIRSGYLLTLAMITCLILFAAIWLGFFIAKELSVPIQRLAEATKQVAKGNYDVQIRAIGDDEIAFLVHSFNKMTKDLKGSRNIAENRRLLLETVLSNLAVGVIALDDEQKIISFNDVAAEICSLSDQQGVVGKELSTILKKDTYDKLLPLLESVANETEKEKSYVLEKEISLIVQGKEAKVLCTVGRIMNIADDLSLGTVLLFDDITELSKAQQMAAWREAARRIAHEIKNPLTPIQLSAQRLQKMFQEGQMKGSAHESLQTIVEHVTSIKRLANEFSHFARMPTVEFQNTNLNLLLSDTIAPFAESEQEIIFQFIADSNIPEVSVDPEQIRRVLINLIDNALNVLHLMNEQREGREQGKVVVKSWYNKERGVVGFEVGDNGIGITDADKFRIFQPYFTTRSEGSGLGLAIIASIISEHQGDIRVYDNSPRGARFVVELPVAPKQVTQRRLGGGS